MTSPIIVISNKSYADKHPAQLDHESMDEIESPARLDVLHSAMSNFNFPTTPSGKLTDETILKLVYTPEQLDRLKTECRKAGISVVPIGEEVYVNQFSYDAATSGVRAVKDGIDALIRGDAKHVLCLIRPAGHHALPELPMGFCIMPTAGIGSLYAATLGKRVAVFDYDAHSGNGTSKVVKGHNNILFTEIRLRGRDEYPYSKTYPYDVSGENAIHLDLRGRNRTGEKYMELFQQQIFPAIEKFNPDIIVVSAGTDCMIGDPIGDLGVDAIHIRQMMQALGSLAPSITLTEGGYEMENLYYGFQAHAQGLLMAA